MNRKWLWLIIAIVLGGGCGVETETERKQVATQSVSETIWAPNLYQAYKQNEVAADERFDGKTIIVTGVVDSIGKDIIGTPYVTLRTESFGSNLYSAWVQCMFADTAIEQLSQLRVGQEVKIKGKVSGYLVTVILRGCTLNP